MHATKQFHFPGARWQSLYQSIDLVWFMTRLADLGNDHVAIETLVVAFGGTFDTDLQRENITNPAGYGSTSLKPFNTRSYGESVISKK